jgi:tRNA/tmRNA/rRNA uracil-C5-methylase (TrmA/RlmC/RlmD family)
MGQGVGRIDGWVVLVKFAAPGERIRARIFRNHPNFSEADLVEVLDPSPERIAPSCPLFTLCGGCQYQHLGYNEQLRWKTRQVAELLERMAGIAAEVKPAIASPRQFGYRTKITPHYDSPKAGKPLPIGFLREGSRSHIIDVPSCPLATADVNHALEKARAHIQSRRENLKRGATILIRQHVNGVTCDPREIIEERVGDLQLAFLAGDFFQNNPFILPALVDHVVQQIVEAEVSYLVDAYCGCGLFCLAAAPHVKEAAGVEISESSIQFARKNAERNRLANCKFLAADAAAIFSGIAFPGEDSAVVIDPPRKGCDSVFLHQLFAFAPRRVVYVSCNPATQMRDLRLFLENGYQLRGVQPFDLFPQTKHLECVITLDRNV